VEARVQQQLRGLPAAAVPPASLAAHADRDDARQPEQVLRSNTETRWHMQSSWVVVFVLSWQSQHFFSIQDRLTLSGTAHHGVPSNACLRIPLHIPLGARLLDLPRDAHDTST